MRDVTLGERAVQARAADLTRQELTLRDLRHAQHPTQEHIDCDGIGAHRT